jgi:hypothetical protein
MKPYEWLEAVALMRLNWPHASIADEVVAKWFTDVQEIEGDQVKVAIEALYRDGREFPPNGAQIRDKVITLSDPQGEIEHGEAWNLAKKASLKGDEKAAYEWLEEQCPAAALTVRRLCGGITLTYQVDDEPTVRAQFRDIYRGILAARRRDARYAGLPTAGLRVLERGPRRIGDVLKRALPAGGGSR